MASLSDCKLVRRRQQLQLYYIGCHRAYHAFLHRTDSCTWSCPPASPHRSNREYMHRTRTIISAYPEFYNGGSSRWIQEFSKRVIPSQEVPQWYPGAKPRWGSGTKSPRSLNKIWNYGAFLTFSFIQFMIEWVVYRSRAWTVFLCEHTM